MYINYLLILDETRCPSMLKNRLKDEAMIKRAVSCSLSKKNRCYTAARASSTVNMQGCVLHVGVK